jgi:hypothetical protein
LPGTEKKRSTCALEVWSMGKRLPALTVAFTEAGVSAAYKAQPLFLLADVEGGAFPGCAHQLLQRGHDEVGIVEPGLEGLAQLVGARPQLVGIVSTLYYVSRLDE